MNANHLWHFCNRSGGQNQWLLRGEPDLLRQRSDTSRSCSVWVLVLSANKSHSLACHRMSADTYRTVIRIAEAMASIRPQRTLLRRYSQRPSSHSEVSSRPLESHGWSRLCINHRPVEMTNSRCSLLLQYRRRRAAGFTSSTGYLLVHCCPVPLSARRPNYLSPTEEQRPSEAQAEG